MNQVSSGYTTRRGSPQAICTSLSSPSSFLAVARLQIITLRSFIFFLSLLLLLLLLLLLRLVSYESRQQHFFFGVI